MKTVLLVEDNPDDVFLMERIFKRAPIEAVLKVATDGKQAVDYLKGEGPFGNRQLFPLPDVVFLDLKLPFLHGFQVLEWIRDHSEFAGMKVTVLTSSLEDKDQEKALALRVPFMIKPPSADAVLMAIRALN